MTTARLSAALPVVRMFGVGGDVSLTLRRSNYREPADRLGPDSPGSGVPDLVAFLIQRHCTRLRRRNQVHRGAGIRTRDLLLPKQARYRTAPHPAESTLEGNVGEVRSER